MSSHRAVDPVEDPVVPAAGHAWTAVLDDGPAYGQEHVFAVGPVHDNLYLMPHPAWKRQDYTIVGYDGMEPSNPWPGQVHYKRYGLGIVGEEPEGRVWYARYRLAELDRYRHLFPQVEWDKPVEIVIPDVASGYACPICIARDKVVDSGLTRDVVRSLPKNRELVRQHIREVHE